MPDEFLDAEGDIVNPEELTLPSAVGLARLLGRDTLHYVRMLECRAAASAEGAREVVVFEMITERPQSMAYRISRTERIAAVFYADDRRSPEALALRTSFPLTPHQILRPDELPRSLCLYDRPWSEVSIRWTPATFVERVAYWLAQTARGLLHHKDQPLEPLIFDSGLRLVLPAGILDELLQAEPVRLDVFPGSDLRDCSTYVAFRQSPGDRRRAAPKFAATAFAARPREHGVVRRNPKNLSELHELLADSGTDLIHGLRVRLQDWEREVIDGPAGVIFIVAIPLTRTEGGDAERWDFWAFVTFRNVREVGIAVGLWGDIDGQLARNIRFDDSDRGSSVPLDIMTPHLEFSRSGAASANGIEPDVRKVVAVGAGSVGSQVIDSLARSGFGRWTVIDEDTLLPHNLARHILDKTHVGEAKAVGMAAHLDRLYREASGAGAIVADVLSPGDRSGELSEAFASAEIVLDLAASVPVGRHLALAVVSRARRVSVFLNPPGNDVVVLAEGEDRAVLLDAIETQYYRAAARDDRLAGHLGGQPGRLRYGRSCRDITSEMPTHLVAMHAAIAGAGVRRASNEPGPSIRVWRCDPGTMAVTPVEVAVRGASRHRVGGWTLVVDDALLDRLSEARAASLPNETGGVLVGIYDIGRRTIYLADSIPSPPDSVEWPTLYIRGSDGLSKQIRDISNASAGQLEYVGEWHSHPDGCDTRPSGDDKTVLAWLSARMTPSSLPALMGIAGEGRAFGWLLDDATPGVDFSYYRHERGPE